MNYSELLSSYIKESNMSLSMISDKLKEKGFSTDKGYLSKLQNGKIPPAGEKLNLALANILNGDATKLEFLAYVEKAPDLIKSILSNLDEELINSYIIFSNKFSGRNVNFLGGNDPDIEESEEFQKIREFTLEHIEKLFYSGESSTVNESTLNMWQNEYKEYAFFHENKDKIKNYLENYGYDSAKALINKFLELELKDSKNDYISKYKIQDPELNHWYQTLPLSGEKKLRKLRTIWEMMQDDDE